VRYLSLEESLEGETTGGCYLWKHLSELRLLTSLEWEWFRYDCGSPFESQNCLLFASALRELPALRSLQLDTWFCTGAVKPGDPQDGNASAETSAQMRSSWQALTGNLATLQQLTMLKLTFEVPPQAGAWHSELLCAALRQVTALRSLFLEGAIGADGTQMGHRKLVNPGSVDIASRGLMAKAVGSLVQLTRLNLSLAGLHTRDFCRHCGGLSNLQTLTLRCMRAAAATGTGSSRDSSAPILQTLLASITQSDMRPAAATGRDSLRDSSAPVLGTDPDALAGVLMGMTQLTSLDVMSNSLQLCNRERVLVEALPALQQLARLYLHGGVPFEMACRLLAENATALPAGLRIMTGMGQSSDDSLAELNRVAQGRIVFV
jgi:hypothetical protein